MDELIGHLVDAPQANILIVAGLVFLGIAVVGKISGKIEPGKFGRITAALIGLGLVAYGLRMHSDEDKARVEAQQQAEKDKKNKEEALRKQGEQHVALGTVSGPFLGTWKNTNLGTEGVTRLKITQGEGVLLVQAWHACKPADCDWGVEKANVKGGSASVSWDQTSFLRKMRLTPDAQRLRVFVDSVPKDSHAAHQFHGVFARAQ